MTKKTVKKLVALLSVFIFVLMMLLLVRFYLINYMDNYPLYVCRQNKALGPTTSDGGSGIYAEVRVANLDIKGSVKGASIKFESGLEKETYTMLYIKFDSNKVAEQYLLNCDEDENIEREVVGKYYFEYPKEKGEKGEYVIIKPSEAAFTSDPSFLISFYKKFVLLDFSS